MCSGSLAQRMLRKSVIQHETAMSRRSRRQWMNMARGNSDRQQAEVQVVVGHLVHDAIGAGRRDRRQVLEVPLGQGRAGPRRRGAVTHSRGAPESAQQARGWPRTVDGPAAARRPRGSANGWPAPARRASCPSAAGRRRRPAGAVEPGAGSRAKRSASKARSSAVDEPLVLGRDVLALSLWASSLRDRVGLRRHSAARELAAAIRARGPARTGAGRGAWRQLLVGQSLFHAPPDRRRAACRGTSVASRACGIGNVGWNRSAVRKAASASAISPLLLVQPAQVQLRRRGVRLQPDWPSRKCSAGLGEPALFLQCPAQREMRARPIRVRGPAARSQHGMASAGSSPLVVQLGQDSQNERVGRLELDGLLQPDQGVVELPLRCKIRPRWAWARASSGSSRSASRYADRAST